MRPPRYEPTGRSDTSTPFQVHDYDESMVSRAETIHMLFGMDFPRQVVQSVLACTGDVDSAAHDVLADQLQEVRSELADRIERLTDTHRQVSAFLEQRSR